MQFSSKFHPRKEKKHIDMPWVLLLPGKDGSQRFLTLCGFWGTLYRGYRGSEEKDSVIHE